MTRIVQALIPIVVLILMMCSTFPLQTTAQTEMGFLSIWGGSGHDIGCCLSIDSSDNSYVTGITDSFGGSKSFLLKYNSTGSLLWQRAWGASAGCGGVGGGDVVDSTGNVIVVGTCDTGTFLLEFDPQGNLRWQTGLAAMGKTLSYGEGVALDSSHNIYVVGGTEHYDRGQFSDNDTLLLKYNSTGSLLWQTTWRAGAESRGYGVAVAPSSGDVYVAGAIGLGREGAVIPGFGNVEASILKFDSTGQLIWQKTWSGTEFSYGVTTSVVTYGLRVVVDPSGIVYVLGDLGVLPYEEGPFLLKLDPQGNLMWQRSWWNSDPRGTIEYGFGLALDLGGNIYITGEGNLVGASGYVRVVILRVSATGNLTGDLEAGTETAGSYGGLGNRGIDLALSKSGYVYVTGYVTEVPPYRVTFDNYARSDRDLSSFSLGTRNNSSVSANFTPNSPNVMVFTPLGNTSYTAKQDVFLAKYDAALKAPSTTPNLLTRVLLIGAGVAAAVSVSAAVLIMLRRRRRFSTPPQVKTAPLVKASYN